MPLKRYVTVSVLFVVLSIFSFSTYAQSLDRKDEETIQALLLPFSQSNLSSQLSAKIKEIPFTEGESFEKDNVLISFDCSLQRAAYRKAIADKKAATEKDRVNRDLAKLDSVSSLELTLSASELEKAKAAVSEHYALVQFCDIKAPYTGKVVSIHVNEHENVQQGDPLLKIIEDTKLKTEIYVDSSWITKLNIGDKFIFKPEIFEQDYVGEITAIGSEIDPVSQQLKLIGIVEKDENLIAGMTGSAEFVNKVEPDEQ